MQKSPSKSPRSSFAKYLMAGSGLAMLAVSGAAYAQEATVNAGAEDIETVVVVGARAAQQSSNERKKRAKTPTDSIVADDVGAFPDRNLNEAISRIAGAAIERNQYGEGEGVTIRGNGPDLTRVELDGIGVQNSGGLAIGVGDSAGRGADMRELPSDLIKSVDVIKGTTADMTEGGLGGSISIQTRTGLDFKKPYFSMRVGTTRNSLGKEYRPDINIVASRKFLEGRLGVLFSVTTSKIQNNGHNMSVVTSDNAGYARSIDWDNSPNKTFTFNPSTVTGDGANTPLASWANSAGTGTVFSKTPLEVVTLSAQAQSKDQCNTLFPLLSDAELAGIAAGTSNANRVAAQNQRMYERITCLNQWNDYHPSLIRNFQNSNDDDRLAADLRFDFKVNDHLSVYAKYSVANRHVDDQYRNRNLGGVNINTAGRFVDSLNGGTNGTFYPSNSINYRTPVAGSGYYLYNGGYLTTPISIDINPNAGTGNSNVTNFAFPTLGQTVNVDPNSVKVDANHHVTQMTITDGAVSIDQISTSIISDSTYMQFGGEYKNGPVKLTFVWNRGESKYSRDDRRTSISAPYGAATLAVQPSGLWSYTLPAGFDQTNPANYVVTTAPTANITAAAASVNNPASPAYTIAQQPWVTPSFAITFQPRLQENSEDNIKLDLTYRTEGKIPFFTQFKTGYSNRKTETQYWGPGGYTVKEAVGTFGQAGYQAPIVVPTLNLRGSFRACDDTKYGATGTAAPAGALSCNYGYVANTNLSTKLTGVTTFTPSQLQALIGSIFVEPDSVFFDGYPGAGNISNWNGLDINKLWSQVASAQNANYDCIKVCRANDGNMYEQPVTRSQEDIKAAYFMMEFEQNLPLGMVFDGNVGLRVVESQVGGTGVLQLNSIRKNANFNPANPTAAAGVTTYTFRSPFTMTKTTRDWLPSYNANLWVVPDQLVLRYSTAKTVARPPINRLIPAGNCTNDERNTGTLESDGSETDMTCSGTIGNPNLKPYTAKNQQMTLEWYPNKDTMFSLAYHKLDVRIGGPVAVTQSDGKLFAGTGLVDPQTGQSIDNTEFTYSQWVNDSGYGRTGWEFSSKTAFTFLPWYLRYTGADFNISTLEGTSNVNIVDPNTGDKMRPPGESEYYANLSIWYDDGKLNGRVSYQKRAESFSCISPCGTANTVNNYPGAWGVTQPRPIPYNPGSPRFNDETQYLDAKVTYKVRPGLELYWEGRNLTKQASTLSGGDYNGFAGGTENLWKIAYGGVRTMFGITYRMQ
ncbi:TonB-dependent receptor [Asticcacaulis sp. DW145]|uniref:TonB-dependent receptor n=1 Tax=unclassified Asticcacaulis TaxID=2628350 RepID=UPI003091A095|nr:TonB-dependent receptor [Asticcacaulis sp. DW145]